MPHQRVDYVGPAWTMSWRWGSSSFTVAAEAGLGCREIAETPWQLPDSVLSHFPPLTMLFSGRSPRFHRTMMIIRRNSFGALCLDSKPTAETRLCSRSLLSCLVYIVRLLQLHWHLASVRIFHHPLIWSPSIRTLICLVSLSIFGKILSWTEGLAERAKEEGFQVSLGTCWRLSWKPARCLSLTQYISLPIFLCTYACLLLYSFPLISWVGVW